jgi:RES domain
VIDAAAVPISQVAWVGARRIIRSLYPPIDLFEDIADPADWPLLMAPFTHVSTDRASRFTNGTYGVLYAADRLETALSETIYHHQRFMARTAEPAGWTSQFREIVLDVKLRAHDLRGGATSFAEALLPVSYVESQGLAADLRARGSDGITYPSCRQEDGECVALFYPDLAENPVQG